jgi:hypothetical protein
VFVFFLAWLGNIAGLLCASFALGGVALIGEAFTSGAHAWGKQNLLPLLAPLFVAPLIEEGLRAWVLAQMAKQPGEARPDQYRWPIVAFGLGFGIAEAAPRWVFAAQQAPNFLLAVGPALPLVMHVGLTIAIALFVIARRPVLGFALCAVIHAVHNYFAFFVFDTDPIFVSALPVHIGGYALAVVSLLIFWRSHAPKLQFRMEHA